MACRNRAKGEFNSRTRMGVWWRLGTSGEPSSLGEELQSGDASGVGIHVLGRWAIFRWRSPDWRTLVARGGIQTCTPAPGDHKCTSIQHHLVRHEYVSAQV